TGLLANTTYSLYVRSNCGGAFSTWAGPYDFTTACAAFTTIPYLEDFNEAVLPAVPHCMSLENLSGNDWRTVTAPGTIMTGRAANVSYTSSGSPAMDTWLYTEGLSLTGGVAYRLQYKYYNNSTTWAERMAVAWGSAPNKASMTSPLADHPAIST